MGSNLGTSATSFNFQTKHCLNTQAHASPAAPPVVSQATPQAEPIGTNASTSQGEIKGRLELYSLSKAISQEANATGYFIKNHKFQLSLVTILNTTPL